MSVKFKKPIKFKISRFFKFNFDTPFYCYKTLYVEIGEIQGRGLNNFIIFFVCLFIINNKMHIFGAHVSFNLYNICIYICVIKLRLSLFCLFPVLYLFYAEAEWLTFTPRYNLFRDTAWKIRERTLRDKGKSCYLLTR